MQARLLIAVVLGLGLLSAVGADAAPVRVVTTTEDLAAIAREVGGDRIEALALA
jgi:ABC-type Zn uptake system ZnuABC Zn-binding protein ZnuA